MKTVRDASLYQINTRAELLRRPSMSISTNETDLRSKVQHVR